MTLHSSQGLATRLARYFTTCNRQLVSPRSAPPAPKIYDRAATRQEYVAAPQMPEQPHPTDARFGPRDPERGRKATEEVAKGGKLDPRYRPAARRVLAIISTMPIVIVLGYELFQRRFGDKQQKRLATDT